MSVNIDQHPTNPHLFEELTLSKNKIYIFKPQTSATGGKGAAEEPRLCYNIVQAARTMKQARQAGQKLK